MHLTCDVIGIPNGLKKFKNLCSNFGQNFNAKFGKFQKFIKKQKMFFEVLESIEFIDEKKYLIEIYIDIDREISFDFTI
jgi:hypothetical protein